MRSVVGARSGSEAPKDNADCEALLNNVNGDKENDPSELRCRSALHNSNGASQSVAGRASPSPTEHVLAKGEIISEGGGFASHFEN